MQDAQLNIKLPTSMKEDWEDAVDEHPNAASVSHLVRLAVTKEVNRLQDDESKGANEPVEVDLSTVTNALNDIRSEISELNERMDGLEVAADDREELQEAALAVLRLLPSAPAEEIRARSVEGSPEERARYTGSEANIIDVLMERHGYDELLIREGLTRATQIAGVETVELDDGRKRYFFREGYQ